MADCRQEWGPDETGTRSGQHILIIARNTRRALELNHRQVGAGRLKRRHMRPGFFVLLALNDQLLGISPADCHSRSP
jgi:hypothetical protein